MRVRRCGGGPRRNARPDACPRSRRSAGRTATCGRVRGRGPARCRRARRASTPAIRSAAALITAAPTSLLAVLTGAAAFAGPGRGGGLAGRPALGCGLDGGRPLRGRRLGARGPVCAVDGLGRRALAGGQIPKPLTPLQPRRTRERNPWEGVALDLESLTSTGLLAMALGGRGSNKPVLVGLSGSNR